MNIQKAALLLLTILALACNRGQQPSNAPIVPPCEPAQAKQVRPGVIPITTVADYVRCSNADGYKRTGWIPPNGITFVYQARNVERQVYVHPLLQIYYDGSYFPGCNTLIVAGRGTLHVVLPYEPNKCERDEVRGQKPSEDLLLATSFAFALKENTTYLKVVDDLDAYCKTTGKPQVAVIAVDSVKILGSCSGRSEKFYVKANAEVYDQSEKVGTHCLYLIMREYGGWELEALFTDEDECYPERIAQIPEGAWYVVPASRVRSR